MNKIAFVLLTATLVLGTITLGAAQDRDSAVSQATPANRERPAASQFTGRSNQADQGLQRDRTQRDTSRNDNTLGTVQQEEMDGD